MDGGWRDGRDVKAVGDSGVESTFPTCRGRGLVRSRSGVRALRGRRGGQGKLRAESSGC